MRRAHRPPAEAGRVEALRGQPLQRGAGQGLFVVHRRQQSGQALRQHRLAGAGRADQQQAVPSGRGDLQCTLRAGLSFHVAQVGRNGRGALRQPLGGAKGLRLLVGQQRLHDVDQMGGLAHLQPRHQRGGPCAFNG